ncbi:MAG: glycosyltransferase [Chloroflexia bacterium]
MVRGAQDQVTVYTTDAWDLEHFWAGGKRRVDWGEGFREHNGVAIRRFAVRRPPLWRLGYPVTRRLMTHLSDLPVPGGEAALRRAGYLSPWLPSLERALGEETARFDVVHSANISLEAPILAAEDYCRRMDVPLVVTPFVHLAEADRRQVSKYYTMRHQLGSCGARMRWWRRRRASNGFCWSMGSRRSGCIWSGRGWTRRRWSAAMARHSGSGTIFRGRSWRSSGRRRATRGRTIWSSRCACSGARGARRRW